MKSSPTRVLIIDDDPLIRTLLVSTLRKDCLVAVAAEGSEGYLKALELNPNFDTRQASVADKALKELS